MEPVTAWRVHDVATGRTIGHRLTIARRRGRRPTVKTLHKRLLSVVTRPAPRGSVRVILDGRETAVTAGGAPRLCFEERVEHRAELLARRGFPQAGEDVPPTGQAAGWYADVVQCVPRTGQAVARQLARLCGDDSQVTISGRSLADAVGHRDRAGRRHAFTERGVRCLVDAGWLDVETSGKGPESISTYRLMPADQWVDYYPTDDKTWSELEDDWN